MKIEFSSTGIVLAHDQFLSLTGALGARVACAHGSVWITQDGDPRDIVLQAGESFVLDRAGPVIVQAFAPAQITIAEPESARRGAAPSGRLLRPAPLAGWARSNGSAGSAPALARMAAAPAWA